MLKERRAAYLMIAPALFAVLAIVVYPLAFATYYSLRKVRPNLEGEFVGLANYAGMLRNEAFSEALRTTLLFTVASAGLSLLIGFGLALLLARPFAGRGAVTAAIFLPWIFPVVVTAALGRLAVNEGAILQSFVESLGLVEGPLPLNRAAMFSVAVLLDVWRSAPFVALLLLTGMRTIPKEIYEAASVEGASSFQKIFKITLPLLRPTILIVALIRLLDAFRVYDLFWVMAARELESLSTYVYQNVLLSQINFGLGSAAAVFVFACALATALFFILVLQAQLSTDLGYSGLHAGEDPGSRTGANLSLTAGAGALAALFLAPVAWVFVVSIFPSSSSFDSGLSPTAYEVVLYDGRLVTGIGNSLVIAGFTMLLTLFLACPAAYAIARLRLRYGNGILGVMLAIAFFPPVAVLVPMLVQLRELGVVGTRLGTIVPHTAFFLPFAIWLLTTFFRELPAEIEDAARVDGAGRLQVLTRITLPLAAPSVFATGAFVFVLSWNEFTLASTFTFAENVRPATVVLGNFVANLGAGAPPGPLAAASLLATLPPTILFLVFRKRILAGLAGDPLGG